MAEISPNVSSPVYTANGIVTAFTFPFSVVSETDVLVLWNGAPHATGYNVTFGDLAGTVTFQTPPPNGTKIQILLDPDYLQTSEFADQGSYNLSTVNAINRRAVIKDLALKEGVARSIKFPHGTAVADLPALPIGVVRALGYNGQEFVWAPNDAVTVASDLVQAATARAGAEAAALAAADDRDAVEVLLAQQPRRVAKYLDSTVISSTVLVTDTNLVVPLGANSLTVLRGHIDYTAGATGDLKWQHAGPTAVSVRINRKALAPGDTAYSGIMIDTTYSSSEIIVGGGAGAGVIEFDATIRNGPTAGNFNIRWAQNAPDATATTFKAGSRIEYFGLPASADFAFSSTAIAKLGSYSGPVSAGGHNVISLQAGGILNSYIETMVAGSAVEAQLFTGNYTVTIDDGTPMTIAGPGGNTWGFVSLFSGLEDEPHRVKVKGVAIDSDITFRVVGYAPNLERPSDIPSRYRIYDAAYSSYIAKDGAPDPYTGNYGTGDQRVAVQSSACGFGLRFSASTTSVRVWIYDGTANSQHILLQDGVAMGTPYTTSGSSLYKLVTLATGLSGSHEYEIQAIHSGKQSYIFAIFVDTLDAVAHTAKNLDAWYGDSNVEMQIGEDSRGHAAYLQARRNGRACIRKGLGGQKVSPWGRDNTSLITSGLSQVASRIFNMLGVNDYHFSTPLATFEADYTTMLANQRSGSASAPIICLGIHEHYRPTFAGTPYSDADRIAYNTRIQAAVAARLTAGDTNVFYIDTTGWIDGTNPTSDLRDNVHLSNPLTVGSPVGWVPFEAQLNSALVVLGI